MAKGNAVQSLRAKKKCPWRGAGPAPDAGAGGYLTGARGGLRWGPENSAKDKAGSRAKEINSHESKLTHYGRGRYMQSRYQNMLHGYYDALLSGLR